ncbi:hypothetical protein PoHVEF18_006188 [Penicillium ochrochloron]
MKELMISPGPDELLVCVMAAAANPKDWKASEQLGFTSNPGDDMAGIVEAVGSDVLEFKPGDHVAALHRASHPMEISEKTTFEEAAAVPLAAMIASLALFRHLGFPAPWDVTSETSASGPHLIYGASGAVGAYAVQLAVKAGLYPIIAIAGRSSNYVQSIIDPSKGDKVLDYREGLHAVVFKAKEALGGKVLYHAFDCTL